MIIKNMNRCVNPCEDFYEFACGNYIKRKSMPDDKSTVNVPHTISDELETKIRVILEDENSNCDVRAFKLAKKLYKNCMNIGMYIYSEHNPSEYMMVRVLAISNTVS